MSETILSTNLSSGYAYIMTGSPDTVHRRLSEDSLGCNEGVALARFDRQASSLFSLRVTTYATTIWDPEGAVPWRGGQVLTTPAAEKR